MKLKPAQQEEIETLFNSEDSLVRCPICSKKDWAIGEETSELAFSEETATCISMLCRNCGFIIQHKVQ